jgi:ketose-bisphosphate aldolase
VPAFNIFNLETAQAVVLAAEKVGAPVILQINRGAASHGGWTELAAIAHALARRARVPVSIHLDHGSDLKELRRALGLGFTSVMIDGSRLPYSQNVRITRNAVKAAAKPGVPVEAELGIIHGVEDDISVGMEGGDFSDPDRAGEFIRATGCESLAVAIGNAHGIYQRRPSLDFDRLEAVQKRVRIPLVLHGGSGLGRKDLRQAIRCGVRKVNFSTEIKNAFRDGLFENLRASEPGGDARKALTGGRDYVYRLALAKFRDLAWTAD